MTEKVAFLMKDFVLLAASFYLLKQDLQRLLLEHRETIPSATTSFEMPTGEDRLRRVVQRAGALNPISNYEDAEMKKLAEKVTIITASKGIGAAAAKALAAEGAAVAVNYSSGKQGAERVVSQITREDDKAMSIASDTSA
jgi:hypothetical protein